MRKIIGVAALGLVVTLGACSPAAEAPAPAAPAAEPAAPAAEPAPTPAPAAEAPAPAAAPTEVTAQTMALAITDASGTQYSGDTARGQNVFKKCTQCHSPVEGKNGTGPSLYGIVGRVSGTVPDFKYSDANRNSNVTWTEENLFVYLEKPTEFIPGTIMVFPGLRNPQDRADVIAYLKSPA